MSQGESETRLYESTSFDTWGCFAQPLRTSDE